MWRKRLRASRPSSPNGQPHPSELVERAFQRIDGLDSAIQQLCRARREGALAAATESDRRRSRGAGAFPARRHSALGQGQSPRGRLSIDLGKPGAQRSSSGEGRAAGRAAARAPALIIVGKTNVPEFTLEGYTRNDLFGVTRNPVERGPDARRLERRRGGERRCGLRSGCARHRRRRLDPAPRLPYRPRRLQAFHRPLAARRRVPCDPHRLRNGRLA